MREILSKMTIFGHRDVPGSSQSKSTKTATTKIVDFLLLQQAQQIGGVFAFIAALVWSLSTMSPWGECCGASLR
jgi:hypothetical protein